MSLRSDLANRFQDADYRHAYVDSFVDSSIATQIQVLREQRGLKQPQLADTTGMKQSQISRLENVNNSAWQIRTLKRIAKALDLVLVVRFESFGKLLPDIESFGRKALERPSFAEDPEFGVSVAAAPDDSQETAAQPQTLGRSGSLIDSRARFGQSNGLSNVA